MYCINSKYKCKNKIIVNIKNKYVCLYHFNLYYKKHILKIQQIYRGYKVRNKLNNIYYKLPKDIQNIILYYINLPIYYRNYYKTLNKIIYKKTHLIFNNNKVDINYIIKSYNLFNKYNSILNLNILKYYYVRANDILYQLNNYCYNNYIDIDDINNSYITLNQDYNIINIINTINILTNYKYLYENKYNLIN